MEGSENSEQLSFFKCVMWISYSKMQELIFNIPAQKTHVLILNQLSMLLQACFIKGKPLLPKTIIITKIILVN